MVVVHSLAMKLGRYMKPDILVLDLQADTSPVVFERLSIMPAGVSDCYTVTNVADVRPRVD